MKKTTKGALAAAAAAVLLLGGVGTHASWSDDAQASGTGVGTGHLAITDWVCGDWLLGGTTFTAATDKLIPGDILTRVCTFTLDVEGKNMKAKLSVDVPDLVDGANEPVSTDFITATGAFSDADGAIKDTTTFSADQAVTATLSVSVADAATVPQNLEATLDTITVTATQS